MDNLSTMDQAARNRALIQEVQRERGTLLQFPAPWNLRCPNCDHVVHAQTEGAMDRGFAKHYVTKHRPPTGKDAA